MMRQAGVPVVPTALDYGRRLGEIGAAEPADEDPKQFMARMRAFYTGRKAKFPERFGPVRLREEDIKSGADGD